MTDSKSPTHTAFAMKRINKNRSLWMEIGKGRLDSNGAFHGLLDRLPIGGFTGYVHFARIGTEPPGPEPQRPDDTGEEEET
jgi:hypothetical protein